MANNKYTKEELYKATGIVKRTLKKQFIKGIRLKVTKTEVFDMLYPKLGLSSRRPLWNGPYIDYLNDWYTKLQNDLNELREQTINISEVTLPSTGETTEDLKKILDKQYRYIKALEARIKKLSSENEKLRVAYNGKYTKIDF